MDLIDKQNIVRFEVGEHRGEIARLLQHRAEVVRRFTPISLATILARVVFPNPGGPKISR
ncbi:Uncharacterised protein [Klebsiella pneumoniae]|uniref:Uncharacterized protein n=1 Tax=Klebsiella pneumoniae TaxID=573 RepID=A0A377V8L9_KLEPN|nr:Uncharacterised protein [Klebsiella pneumoniae]